MLARDQLFIRAHGEPPRYEGPLTLQFVTVRLIDAFSPQLLAQLEATRRKQGLETYNRMYEAYLDHNLGECVMRDPKIAELAEASLKMCDGIQFLAFSWAVLPNHVHALLQPREGHTLASGLTNFMDMSTTRINIALDRRGALWQREVRTRPVRNRRQLEAGLDYIHQNPVKVGLAVQPEDWAYSSAWLYSALSN